jgi:hypothetical protein
MGDNENRKRFESLALPHLDAACNLARRLTRKDDAVDHHLEAVFAKLGVGSRIQAVTVALTAGPLETIGDPRRRSNTLHLFLGIPALTLSVFVASPLPSDTVGRPREKLE